VFIHLGGDTLVESKKIITILNVETALGANSSKEFLKTAQEEGFIVNQDQKEYKSIIVTDKEIYLSPISTLTLKKRASFVDGLNE
jgi:hypothetical protein